MPIQSHSARQGAVCPSRLFSPEAPPCVEGSLPNGKALHHARRQRQQGFGVFATVMLTSVLCLSLIVGYAGVLTRQEANGILGRNQTFANETVANVERAWPRFAAQFDDNSISNVTEAADVLRVARVQMRGPATAYLSKVVALPAEGIAYRSLLVMFPSNTDDVNPPNIASFINTGTFVSCPDAAKACETRAFAMFTSLETERRLSKETHLRLQKVAQKAQSYFKARTLQDPERNISVNYFRRPMGNCDVLPQDLGCLDTFTPLAAVSGDTSYTRTTMAVNLGLTDEELFSAWGGPLEASNLQDSYTLVTPFSLAVRARRPDGTYISIQALQQI